ncbi:MAG: LytTR family DNA-binding domain-containing protein [Saprospiraceae bacterium]
MTAISNTRKIALHPLASNKAAVSKISLPMADGLRFERLSAIVYMEASGNYTFIYFQGGERLLVCKTLQEMQSQLKNAPSFIRIHRSTIINVEFLDRYVRGKGGYVCLEGGISLPVSSSRRQPFLEALDYLFNS